MFTFRSVKTYTSTDIKNILKELLNTIKLSEIDKDLLINKILTTYKNGSLRNFVIIELTKFLIINKLLNSETTNLSDRNIDIIIDEIIKKYKTGDLYVLCIIVLVNFILTNKFRKLSIKEIKELTNFIQKIYVSGNIYKLCITVFNIYNIIKINKLSNNEIYKLLNDIINSSNIHSDNPSDFVIIESSRYILNKLSSNNLNATNIDILTKTILKSYKKYPIKIYIICNIIYNICYLYKLTPNKISQDIIDEVIKIIGNSYKEGSNIDELCIKEFSIILINKLINHRLSDKDIKNLLKIILELYKEYKENYLNGLYDIVVNVYNTLIELKYSKSYQIIRYFIKYFLEKLIFDKKTYTKDAMKDYIETEYNEQSKSINSDELKQLSIGSDKSIRLFFEGRVKKPLIPTDNSKFINDIFKDIFKVIYNKDYEDFLQDILIKLSENPIISLNEDEDEDEIHLDDFYGYMYNKYLKDKDEEHIYIFINYLIDKLNKKFYKYIISNYYNERIKIRESMRLLITQKSLHISFKELIDGLHNIINVNGLSYYNADNTVNTEHNITSRMSIKTMINKLYLAMQSNSSPDERYNNINYTFNIIRCILCQAFLKMIKFYEKELKNYKIVDNSKISMTVKEFMKRTGNTHKSSKDFIELISSKY